MEAAILFPCLLLILCWAIGLTDVLILKLKGAEALRYALWETTVFKEPARIGAEVREKFADLRSPARLSVAHTGLSMFPRARDLAFRAEVDTLSTRVAFGGDLRLPAARGFWDGFVEALLGMGSRGVDAALERQRFNVYGKAVARVALTGARAGRSPILPGGDLLGLRGGHDLAAPGSLTRFSALVPSSAERPMELVFDTWKAWPRPALYTLAGGPTDVGVSPSRTYPVVEEQVSVQVGQIAFFGLSQMPWFHKLRDIAGTIGRAGATKALVGGQLPDIFSTARMDGPTGGPITILPVEPPDAAWVPGRCDVRGASEACATQRAGDVRTAGSAPVSLDELATLGPGVDRTRYTLPYRINSDVWSESGGTDDVGSRRRTVALKARLKSDNDYVRAVRCRGHFFAGAQRAEEPEVARRYGRGCSR